MAFSHGLDRFKTLGALDLDKQDSAVSIHRQQAEKTGNKEHAVGNRTSSRKPSGQQATRNRRQGSGTMKQIEENIIEREQGLGG
jgi:hypothetical protein